MNVGEQNLSLTNQFGTSNTMQFKIGDPTPGVTNINLALRQQLLALHAQRPRRRLTAAHKLFWVGRRKVWARWKQPLILVTPRTVVNWHRAGFRLYEKWISPARPKGGRKPISKEIRALLFQMGAEKLTKGATRLQGER